MTLGDPSNIPACYPSGHSAFSPGIICPAGWHASSTSTVSSTSYLAICCPSAVLASSIGVVWLPSTQGCSANLSQVSYSLVTNGLVIQLGSSFSYQRLTMGHLNANAISLHWQEKDLIPASRTSGGVTFASSAHTTSTIVSPTATTATVESSRRASHDGVLSSAQKTAIAIIVPVMACISAVAAVWVILRYRNARQCISNESPAGRHRSLLEEREMRSTEIEVPGMESELPVPQNRTPELCSNEVQMNEMDVSSGLAQLPGGESRAHNL